MTSKLPTRLGILGVLLQLFGFAPASVFAQNPPTFADDIAPIIYIHCTPCHRTGEIGRFPLTTYQEVSAWAAVIRNVTQTRYMPPWKADPAYRSFLGENYLTNTQIQKIADWVAAGNPRGNIANEPTPPTFPTGSQIGTPDLVLSYSQMHRHPAGSDDYRVFVLPMNNSIPKSLSAIEMRPGNSSIVHHVLFSWDTSGVARQNDAATPEYGYTNFGGFGVQNAEARQLPSYAPGAKPKRYPNGTGQTIPANADLLMQVHYAPTTVDAYDSSTVNLFFNPTIAPRQVIQYIMLPQDLTNGPFVIDSGQVKRFHGQLTVPFPASLISIGPHMHLLGKDWEVFAIKPNGDTINLVKVPNWDFHWQGTYNFRSFIKLPTGTVIHAYATYDNTINNPNQPLTHPRRVTWGENTTDEMYYLSFWFTPYVTGDENVVFPDDTLRLGAPIVVGAYEYHMPASKLYPVYPNPAGDFINVGFALAESMQLSLDIVDIQGQVVQNIEDNTGYMVGNYLKNVPIAQLSNGMYAVRIRGRGFSQTQKFMLNR